MIVFRSNFASRRDVTKVLAEVAYKEEAWR